ncbi:TetR family transcriptional regulator [Pedobacter steynii]
MFAPTIMSKAAATKQLILNKSLELIYKNGYQATSIDEIIATTNVTKGAFFYHFSSKEEMGLAIINELFYPRVVTALAHPLTHTTGITDAIYHILHTLLHDDSVFNVAYGCPVVNLVEEMSPVNESFKKALNRLLVRVQEALEGALRTAQTESQIRKDVDCKAVATFILTSYSGIRNIGKIFGKGAYSGFLKEIRIYLNKLK